MGDFDRELGSIDARLNHLEESMRQAANDIRSMRETMDQARGGWRATAFVISVSTAVGALLAKVMPLLGGLTGK